MVRERERISLPPTDGLLAAIKRGGMEHKPLSKDADVTIAVFDNRS